MENIYFVNKKEDYYFKSSLFIKIIFYLTYISPFSYSSGAKPTLVCIFESKITKIIVKILAIITKVIGSEKTFNKSDDKNVMIA